MLFITKKHCIAPQDAVTLADVYTAWRSALNRKWSKQANLLMLLDNENRLYVAMTKFSRLPKSLNTTHKGVYHFSINWLNSFCRLLARNKHYVCSSNNFRVKVKMPLMKKTGWNFLMYSITSNLYLC